MKGTILLNYNENTKQVENEEKTRFLRTVLEQMGVPLDDFWSDELNLSADQKIKLRSILATLNVQVIDDFDGNLKIYVENQLVAEWHKCTYKLKRDFKELNPRKQFFLEMEINCWSLFDEIDNDQI